MSSKTPQNPYKTQEFEAFLKTLGKASFPHWLEIARALGVDKETIMAWKKHPKAIEARRKGIEFILKKMQTSGKKDWKMWEKKLAFLDVQSVDRSDITSGGEALVGPIIYKPSK